MAAAHRHTFRELATAIDGAFARWDHAHVHQFWLADGSHVSQPGPDDDPGEPTLGSLRLTLSQPGEGFAYEFDFGDSWLHLCTVGEQRIDPEEELGIVPAQPTACWGWGALPDQYGRRWDDDDGESKSLTDTNDADLPPIGPWQWRRS